ncbi:hypothetical protein ITP53_37240 [Nonomuraea sp. K274]|uniref:Trypsin-co-occurring domain-containing protein n=1 Tax=Nonomuraea cypriaca TaxID=1187855 RepID=A0A931ALN0_9ACTN|nr:CU044_2847 family protein [Nonomuraea cypriaca]MBF8191252.1 hypothetical protein [Nonomuraea cypriaca]
MTYQLVRWEVDGASVLVETSDEEIGGWAPATPFGKGVVREATMRFEDALVHVRDAAAVALRTFRDIPVGPDEVEIEFGVKLGSEAGAVIAKAALEGHLTVRLKWSGKPAE